MGDGGWVGGVDVFNTLDSLDGLAKGSDDLSVRQVKKCFSDVVEAIYEVS